MTGKELQDAIVAYAQTIGYRAAHFTASRVGRGEGVYRTAYAYDTKGFPDLVLVRPESRSREGRIVFAEVKGRGDSLRVEQKAWIADLQDAHAEVAVAVFTVADWPDAVQEILR